MVGLRAKRPHFTEKWLRFTLHFVAHFYSARNIQIDISDTMTLRRKHNQAPAIHKEWLNAIDKCKMTYMVDAELSLKTIGGTTKWRCHNPSVSDNCLECASAIQKFFRTRANTL